ncbi:MAG: nuclear transport factor 2 family protein [Dyadobacter sp.]|uniref:nuclear transport factor 2 family protein n=1 Tax=Dyadobacter sp. TaxID=1914288 RepID=UPI0032671384
MKTILTIIATIMTLSMNAQNTQNAARSNDMPLKVVTEFLSAYMAHDHEKFASKLHPDLVWVQPGNNRVSGEKKSKNELLQMGGKMAQLSEGTLKLESVKYFDANGNKVACILHWKAAQPNGAVLDVENVDVYTIENGLIVHAVVYSANIAAENDFWGPVP